MYICVYVGTRSSKRQKGKTASHYKAQASQAHQRNSLHRQQRQKLHLYDEINPGDEYDDEHGKQPKKEIQRRKRFEERNRAFDRQFKETGLIVDTTDVSSNPEVESLCFSNLTEKVIEMASQECFVFVYMFQ